MTGRSMQQGMQHQRMLSVLQEVWGYTAFRYRLKHAETLPNPRWTQKHP